MDDGEVNLRWASALAMGLVACGVRHVVVSPGARSTPLTLACACNPDVRAWVLPDERCAAFFALGLGRAGAGPSAVIATSGSAPANWYPAVIEAAQDLQPLILISADRPAQLQECGANQTVDQTRLFGAFVRGFFTLPQANIAGQALRHVRSLAARAVDRSRWPLPGPVHINVPLAEPLVWAGSPPAADLAPKREPVARPHYPHLSPARADVAALATRLSGRRGLIVCGRGHHSPQFPGMVTRLAQRLACPVLADPLSGLRFGSHDRALVLAHYDTFLRRARFVQDHRPGWVLRFGAVPTSKVLLGYLDTVEPGGTVLVVPYGPWPDPTQRSDHVLHADPSLLCAQLAEVDLRPASPDWSVAFLHEERRARRRLEGTGRPLEAAILDVLARRCPEGSTVFCGNSMVIRDVDSFLSGGRQALILLGNRGASGIDGNVSTLLGIAGAARGPVVGLMGDLALYHDMNGLLAAKALDATVVVFNNGGGGIFSYLPQAQLPHFERYWLTPTGLDLAQVARLYDLGHRRVSDVAHFERALIESLDTRGVDLIEVVVDREESVRRHRDYWAVSPVSS